MSIKFACPHCATVLQIAEHLAGKNIKCPKCANVVFVPGGQEEAEYAVQDLAPAAEGGTPEPLAPGAPPPPPGAPFAQPHQPAAARAPLLAGRAVSSKVTVRTAAFAPTLVVFTALAAGVIHVVSVYLAVSAKPLVWAQVIVLGGAILGIVMGVGGAVIARMRDMFGVRPGILGAILGAVSFVVFLFFVRVDRSSVLDTITRNEKIVERELLAIVEQQPRFYEAGHYSLPEGRRSYAVIPYHLYRIDPATGGLAQPRDIGLLSQGIVEPWSDDNLRSGKASNGYIRRIHSQSSTPPANRYLYEVTPQKYKDTGFYSYIAVCPEGTIGVGRVYRKNMRDQRITSYDRDNVALPSSKWELVTAPASR